MDWFAQHGGPYFHSMGWGGLLVGILLILAITIFVKYLFFDKRR